MAQRWDNVREHYSSPDIISRILAAVAEAGQRTDELKAEMLYPYDQLHGREIVATREHVERIGLKAGMQVLDVGCGIGGPARYIASICQGVTVTGIDVTPDFVATARDLTRRCGLDDRVAFVEADALSMPFADSVFDAAICFYVGMNIADKAELCREIYRVLKHGGRVVWSEVTLGPMGPARFPLPWASGPTASFLVPPQVLRQVFTKTGFNILETVDETSKLVEAAQRPVPPGQAPPPAQQAANQIVMGKDFVERRQNFIRNLTEARLVSVLIEAEKV